MFKRGNLSRLLAASLLVTVGFIGGLGNSLQFPAFQAAVPLLVDRDALDRANGLNQLGPAIGVVIVSFASLNCAYAKS